VRDVLKPAALRTGARLAIVSPASAAKAELVAQGIERLKRMGYDPVLSPHALDRGPLYYAGRIADRLSDLHAAFADPSIDGIICTRGGLGSAELLPHLDVALIRANPKVFVGYSDQTSLQCWLRNEVGLVCFYAPMVAADFARVDGVDAASWQHAVTGDVSWSLKAEDGLRVLRPGVVEGRLGGGCLAILAEALGTPYAARGGDGILFLEDIGVKPYQWDRMLVHLRYAGVLDSVQGIVFGDMRQCAAVEEMELLEGAILHALRDFPGPIAIGLRCGHVDGPNVTLPLGVRARLDCSDAENPRLDFLEAAVNG
jgi:muramoyltetrapeptide carboxypeptidase